MTLFAYLNTQAQFIDSETQSRLKQHINTLASNKLEGRETGTIGEKLAATYITKTFTELGLKADGDSGYYQAFPFFNNYKPANSRFSVGQKTFNINDDFYAYPSKLDAQVVGRITDVGYGLNAPALNYNSFDGLTNLKGTLFLIQIGHPENGNPHSRFESMSDIQSKLDTAMAYGAIGVIFICGNESFKKQKPDYAKRIGKETIPAIIINKDCARYIKNNLFEKATITTSIKKEMGIGYNLIGSINNNKPYTVVLTAHYDHLGYGDEGSLHTGKKAIHNGADDNASGVAAILELARLLQKSSFKNYNYTFIAFSGEEKGLLGSNYYVKQPGTPLASFNYNINLDMVGRLSTTNPVLQINGVGTAMEWPAEIEKLTDLKISTTASGIGPSDQTSFYLANVPAIHFFSGTHTDYHKPSDDADKINYQGTISIMQMLGQLIGNLDAKPKITYTKTNDSTQTGRSRFKVTLGVIPDYAFEGEGMRIDGITPSKPAANAGLLKGDIVLQIGETTVSDMNSYMKALGQFSKGDITNVTIKRGQETMVKSITF
ncbi:MAG: M28 family peptidase [Bacteroidia bacterium]|nr:M28 family peptidase [Bacteroidia bacterium]